jgi:hypothetical protein
VTSFMDDPLREIIFYQQLTCLLKQCSNLDLVVSLT